jgi:hypothetical protein
MDESLAPAALEEASSAPLRARVNPGFTPGDAIPQMF